MNKKTVVLIHGLMTSPIIMKYMEKSLIKAGYKIYQFGYNSRQYSSKTLEDLHRLIESIKQPEVYLIGHSMGGLIARNYVHNYPHSLIKGIVTIATPHNQSICAHNVSKSYFKKYLGSAGHSGLTQVIPEWPGTIPLGCIAGQSSSKLSANFFIIFDKNKSPHDGTVFLEEAILKNCHDSIVIKGSHTGLLFKKHVALQCINFLETYNFIK